MTPKDVLNYLLNFIPSSPEIEYVLFEWIIPIVLLGLLLLPVIIFIIVIFIAAAKRT